MNMLINKQLDYWVSNNIIKEDEKEIVEYGLKQLINYTIMILVMAVMSVLMNLGWIWVLYLVCFIPIRIYAGGYHCNTRLSCGVLSTVIVALGFSAIKYLEFNIYITAVVFIITSIFIIKVSPLDNKNNRLSFTEKKVYKRYVILAIFVEAIISVVTTCMGKGLFLSVSTVTLVTSAILLIAVIIEEKRRSRDDKDY